MGSRILYNIATRSRARQARELIDYIYSNDKHAIILVKIDNDEPDLEGYERHVLYHMGIDIDIAFSNSKVHAINRSIHEYWDILVNISDDQRFITPDFAHIIRDNMEHDCFLHFPDEMAQGLSTMSIMDKAYYDRFGYIYHPSYKSLWCDNEATEVAKLLRRHKYVDQVIFRHYHPAWGLAPMDKLYQRNNQYWNQDKRNYNQRKARNFDLVDIDTII